jgi:hypothetical protein
LIRLFSIILLLASSAFGQVSISGTVSMSGTISADGVTSGGGGGSCGGVSYSNSVALVEMTAASSDLANFVYPYTVTYPALADVAHGGLIQHSVTDARGRTIPADSQVCASSSGGSALKFIWGEWNSTTGFAYLKILNSPLHTATNDVPYLFFNNSSVTTDQTDYSLLTDASIDEWCSFWDINCDTNNGIGSGSSPTAGTTGRVGSGLSLTQSNSDFVTLGSPAWSGGNNLTVMGWLNTAGGGFMRAASNLNSSGHNGWLFSLTNSSGASLYEDSSGTVNSYTLPCCWITDWQHVAFTSDGATIKGYMGGDLVGSGTGGAIGTPSQNMLIGKNADGTGVLFNGGMDELLWGHSVWSADRINTFWGIQRYAGYSKIFDVSGANPGVRQISACAAKYDTGLVSICTLPTKTTSASNHYVVAVSAQIDALHCNSTPTSLLGLTYTRQIVDDFTGTIHHYYSCIYTAPVTISGVEVLTWPSGNSGALVFEVWNVTASGIVTATSGNTAGPPAVMSATSPGANSFLMCGSKGGTGTSEGYTDMLAPNVLNTDHPAQAYAAWGNVGTGTKTCSILGSFADSGVMIMMPKN